MASASDQEIVTRPLDNTCGHAIENGDDCDNDRASGVSNSGINFIHAADGDTGLRGKARSGAIRIGKVKGIVNWIEGAAAQAGYGNLANLPVRRCDVSV